MTTTHPMIEKCARALCWKSGMNPDVSLGGDQQNWLWHEYIADAEAVLRALREPDEGMLAVLNEYVFPSVAFTAAIDSLLTEQTLVDEFTDEELSNWTEEGNVCAGKPLLTEEEQP